MALARFKTPWPTDELVAEDINTEREELELGDLAEGCGPSITQSSSSLSITSLGPHATDLPRALAVLRYLSRHA